MDMGNSMEIWGGNKGTFINGFIPKMKSVTHHHEIFNVTIHTCAMNQKTRQDIIAINYGPNKNNRQKIKHFPRES